MEIVSNLILHKIIIGSTVILISIILWKIIKHYRYLRKSQIRNTSHWDYISRLMEMLSKLSVASTKAISKVRDFDRKFDIDDDDKLMEILQLTEMMSDILIERRSILTRCDNLVNQLKKDRDSVDLGEKVSKLEADISEAIKKLDNLCELIDSKLK